MITLDSFDKTKFIDYLHFADFQGLMGLRFLIFCLVIGLVTPPSAMAQDAEKDAIKRVVMLESESYLAVDIETWKTTWAPVSYAYWSFSDKSGTQFIDGWEDIQRTFEPYFKDQKPSRSKLSYTWKEIRVYGSGSYVRFQEKSDDNGRIEITDQIRVLEKRDGKWKVVCMSAVVQDPRE